MQNHFQYYNWNGDFSDCPNTKKVFELVDYSVLRAYTLHITAYKHSPHKEECSLEEAWFGEIEQFDEIEVFENEEELKEWIEERINDFYIYKPQVLCNVLGIEIEYNNYEEDLRFYDHSLSESYRFIDKKDSEDKIDNIRFSKQLKKELIEKYCNLKLDEVLPGKHFENEYGGFYFIKEEFQLKYIPSANMELLNGLLKRYLSIIPGIGEFKERYLRSKGFYKIDDLLNNRIYSLFANEVLQIIESKNYNTIKDWLLKRKVPKSHPSWFIISCSQGLQSLMFLDIETLGLFPKVPLIIIGVGFLKSDNSLIIEQYLARDIADEKAILLHFQKIVDSKSIFTFSGTLFDLPFIRSRCNYYGINEIFNHIHFDLFYFSRRMWKGKFPQYDLKTLEKRVLGITRENDLHPTFLINYYHEYLQTKNSGLLKPFIEHNRNDILTTVSLFLTLFNKVVANVKY